MHQPPPQMQIGYPGAVPPSGRSLGCVPIGFMVLLPLCGTLCLCAGLLTTPISPVPDIANSALEFLRSVNVDVDAILPGWLVNTLYGVGNADWLGALCCGIGWGGAIAIFVAGRRPRTIRPIGAGLPQRPGGANPAGGRGGRPPRPPRVPGPGAQQRPPRPPRP